MKKRSILSLTALAAFGFTTVALTTRPVAAPAAVQTPSDPKVARGAYLVKIMACNDCHTPWKMGPQGPEPDMTRMLSGHPQDMVVSTVKFKQEPWEWVG